ncbi:MAG: sigma-70 family RNA polymerase sigma factor [Rikenellaceae bacterium]|jgi:RNA polymerase sigma-70 factor (ECF subfamily)|nr:sigma-70 family RNA polymerase sigma factor [Rikenellaceae bacterium]
MSIDCRQHVEGLRRGSYEDFKALYDEFAGVLNAFVLSLTRSPQQARDVVQDTFMRVWLARESLDPEQSFKAWLFAVSRNRVIDVFRSRMSDPLFDNYLDSVEASRDAGDEVGAKIDFDLFRRRLDTAKLKLTAGQKRIFELIKEQGFAPGEVARMLKLSEQTVYNQLSSALKLLRSEFGTLTLMFALFFD